MKRKILSILITLCLMLSMMPTAALAASGPFSDMPAEDNWAYAALKAAVDNGLLEGTGGKLLPDDDLTRAQMAAVINRAFGAADSADISGFTDVPASAWYAEDIAKAVRMGTFQGSGTAMRPGDPVTRQETFLVLSRAFQLADGDVSTLNVFSDKAQVSSWAAPAVAAMVKAGYVTGDDGTLNPLDNITRAEFAQVLYRMVSEYCMESETYTQNVSGNLLINAPGVTLKGITISGDLLIGEGVGNGDVTLDGVTVTGRIVIRGGGVNSIILTNKSSAGSILIGKTGDGGIRVRADEGCQVEIVYVNDGKDDVILAGAFDQVKVETSTPVSLKDATVTNLTISAEGAQVKLEGKTSVTAAEIPATAIGATMEVGKETSVTKVDSAAEGVKLTGDGTVKAATVSGSNTAVDTKGTTVTVSGDATGVTQNGTEVKPSTTTPSPSGGGGSSYYTASVTSELELTAALADSAATAIRISGSFTLADREAYTTEDVWTKPITVNSGVTLTVGHNRSLYIESTLINNGTIHISGATTGGNYGVLAIRSGGACTNNGTITLDGASASDTDPNGAALRLFDTTLVNNGTITSNAGSDPSFWGGFIAIVDASTLTNNRTITLNGMSLLVVDYTDTDPGSATLYNSAGATLNAADSTCKVEIRDGGTVETHGTMTSAGDLVIGAEADADIRWGGKLVVEEGTVTNSGTITVQGNGSNALVISGTFANTGTINNVNARINMIGTLNNTGSVNINAGAEFLVQDSAVMNGLSIDNDHMTALVFEEAELRSMMTKGYTHFRLDDDIELASDLTVPSGTDLLVMENASLTVAAATGFVSLKLESGATLTLSSGSILKTESDFTVPAIAQIWIASGTLDATSGSIAANSILYYTSGTMNLPAALDGSVSITYGVNDEPGLTAALSNGAVTNILIQDSFSITASTNLTENTTIQDGVTLTIASGGTLNIADGITLTVQAVTGFTNLKIDGGGTVTLSSGAELKTESDISVPAIAQVWIDGGTLNADSGSIGEYSTIYFTSGTISLPSSLDSSVSVPYGVTSESQLETALSSTACTNILIQGSFSVTGDTTLTKDTTVQDGATLTVDTGATLTVQAAAGFVSLKINDSSGITLASGATLTTESSFTPNLAIAQIWINGGALNASDGTIGPGSTIYYTSGTMNLPTTLDSSVSISYSVTDEDGLTAALANGSVTYIMIQDSFDVTTDTTLTKNTTVQDGATLTVAESKTLTVESGVAVSVESGSGLANNGTIYNGGSITIASGATFSGTDVTGTGTFTNQNTP